MIGVGLTAGALWWMGSTDFLLFIAFFSTYMVLVGWRLGQNRKGSVGNIDQALVGLGIIGTLGLLFISADIAFGDEDASFATVPLVFSFICGSLTYFQRLSMKSGTAPTSIHNVCKSLSNYTIKVGGKKESDFTESSWVRE